ncbi:MAG: hypothetical protein D3923_10150, partial [Candidatus Electrothrix sp. AR3]|nr:hypothetical protein [Candidatus Electrothrix sp. AR3]
EEAAINALQNCWMKERMKNCKGCNSSLSVSECKPVKVPVPVPVRVPLPSVEPETVRDGVLAGGLVAAGYGVAKVVVQNAVSRGFGLAASLIVVDSSLMNFPGADPTIY